MAKDKKCSNDTAQGCPGGQSGSSWEDDILLEHDQWLEEEVMYGFRMWHMIFLSAAAVLSIVILLCCCIKFRIPRTKQEIEGDYVRRRILRKFRNRLKAIQNQELDEMDLKRALDKIRAEFKSDTESLAQSEAGFSVATISSAGNAGAGGHHHAHGSTYRRASQIQIDISLEDLRAQSLGFRARMTLALSRFFGRSKVAQSEKSIGDNTTQNQAQASKQLTEQPTEIMTTAKAKTSPPTKLTGISAPIPIPPPASGSVEKSSKDKTTKDKDKKVKTNPKGKDTGEQGVPTTVTTTATTTLAPTLLNPKETKYNTTEKENKKKEKAEKEKQKKEKLTAEKEKEKAKKEKKENKIESTTANCTKDK